MTSNTPSLSDFARRMRALVEEDVRIAADLRELAKEMRDCGLQAVTLKALVKALVLDEGGNSKPLANLKAKIQDSAIYAEALGIGIDGFGEPKRFVVNVSDPVAPPHDPVTGEIHEPTVDPTPPPSAASVPAPTPEGAVEAAGASSSCEAATPRPTSYVETLIFEDRLKCSDWPTIPAGSQNRVHPVDYALWLHDNGRGDEANPDDLARGLEWRAGLNAEAAE